MPWADPFYTQNVRLRLNPGQILATADYAKNFPFVLSDTAQGFYWYSAQSTIHPLGSYYKDSNEVHHVSYEKSSLTACTMILQQFTCSERVSLLFREVT